MIGDENEETVRSGCGYWLRAQYAAPLLARRNDVGSSDLVPGVPIRNTDLHFHKTVTVRRILEPPGRMSQIYSGCVIMQKTFCLVSVLAKTSQGRRT